MKFHLGLEQLPICKRNFSSSGLVRITTGKEMIEWMENGKSERVCKFCWAKFEAKGRKVRF